MAKKKKKPEVDLRDVQDSVVCIIAKCRRALREAGVKENEIQRFKREITKDIHIPTMLGVASQWLEVRTED